jgi:alpha-galactosidase
MNRRSFLVRGTAALGLAVPDKGFKSMEASRERDHPSNAVGDSEADSPAENFAAPAYVRTGGSGETQSWSIGNGFVERTLKFSPARGLYTEAFRHKASGTDFLMKDESGNHPGAEFTFQADSESFNGATGGPSADFTLVRSDVKDLHLPGKGLEILLKGREKPLDVSVFYAVYAGHPVVRKWLSIRNSGSETIRISHLVFEALNLMSAPPDEEILRTFYGVQPREIFFTGRVEDAAILQMNPRTQEGCMVMNEAPGWMKRTEMNGWGRSVQVMFDTDIFPFERRVAPGETYTSAKSSIAFFREDRPATDSRRVMPSYTSKVLMRKGASYQPPWIYNTWEPFQRGINSSIAMELIKAAGRMGLDIFTIDDGWQAEYGENDINLQAFPGGLDEIQRAVEREKMRLGLWAPLAAISTKSKVYREHPEWVCRDENGQPKLSRTMAGQSAVMCLASPYRDVAARRISDLISRYNLAYVKIDLTTVFNAYGERPGCYASGHFHKTWAESLGRIYEGMKYVTEHIYRNHPDVLLDLTFELWGQKHVIDYGLLDAGDLDWMSNVDDAAATSAGPRQARTLLYHRSLAIPVETMLIGNLRAETPSIEERFATACGSAPLLLGDLRQLSSSRVEWYREKIAWFKNLRRSINLSEGFFPLGDWLQPKSTSWDGFARLSGEGEGMIVVFKNETKARDVTVMIPNDVGGRFKLHSVMTGDPIGVFSGRQIRSGVVLPIPPEHKVQIIEVRKA